VGRIW